MIKSEKGSVTLLVGVTVLLIIIILSSSLMLVSLKRKSQLQESKILQEIYGGDNLDEIYQEQLEKKNYSNWGSASISDITPDLYGKYIDLGLDINNNDKTTDDWEIFYAGNDRIYLIAADYVPVTKLTEWGVIGESARGNNGFTKYDENYRVRWTSEPTDFKTLPAEPTNFLSLVMHTKYDLNSSNPNSKAVSYLLDTTAWKGIKKASRENANIDFVIGGPTVEMWCAAWKVAIKEDTNGFVEIKPEATNTNGYYVSSEQSGMQNKFQLYMNGTQSVLGSDKLTALNTTYKTFFPHTESSGYNGCYGYWLASPSAYKSSSLMRVYCVGDVSSADSFSNDALGVRPVVCLKIGTGITWDSEKEVFKLTTSPEKFYFDASTDINDVSLLEDNFTVNLNIKNYSNYGLSSKDIHYNVKLDETDKFKISQPSNLEGTLQAGNESNNTLTLTITPQPQVKLNNTETLIISVTSTSPYKDTIYIPIKVSLPAMASGYINDYKCVEISDSTYDYDNTTTQDKFNGLYGDHNATLQYASDNSIILDENNAIPVFDRSSKNYENGYSVSITIKGDIHQYPVPVTGYDSAGNPIYDRWGSATIFGMSEVDTVASNRLCWFGFRNGYFQIYSYCNNTFGNEDIEGEKSDVDGFRSIKMDEKYNNKILNIQVTGIHNGTTYVYFNGELFTSFPSGNGNGVFSAAIIGDIRVLRGLKFTGNFYDIAVYNRVLNSSEIKSNWMNAKYRFGIE